MRRRGGWVGNAPQWRGASARGRADRGVLPFAAAESARWRGSREVRATRGSPPALKTGDQPADTERPADLESPSRMPILRSSRSAFSLFELVAAIAVILVLAGVVAPAVGGKLESARRARARADLEQVSDAFNCYRNDTGGWPANVSFDASATTASTLVGYACFYARPNGVERWQGPYLEVGWPAETPTAVARLSGGESGGLLDPWGRPYVVHVLERGYAMSHGAIALVCNGANGGLDSTPLELLGGQAGGDDIVLLVTRKL